MGFGERLGEMLKQLGQQLQRAISGNKDKIHSAVDTVGSVANKTTKGKFEDQIAKVGEKTKAGVSKLGSDGQATTDTEAAGAAATGEAGAEAGNADAAMSADEGTGEQEEQPSEPPAP